MRNVSRDGLSDSARGSKNGLEAQSSFSEAARIYSSAVAVTAGRFLNINQASAQTAIDLNTTCASKALLWTPAVNVVMDKACKTVIEGGGWLTVVQIGELLVDKADNPADQASSSGRVSPASLPPDEGRVTSCSASCVWSIAVDFTLRRRHDN
ncbi:hypothetical protein [Parvibaculum sp.]|uniref:hypothetical protein n=1 Tax=Parvibaculum sp. TaxID=2024848 RepID=UPI00320E9748